MARQSGVYSRGMEKTLEQRSVKGSVELRDGANGPMICGYGAVFNSDSHDMGFVEQIDPTAFNRTITQADVRGLGNHNADWVLGRSKAGTMRLRIDPNGLWYEIDVNEQDPDGMRALAKVRRGDWDGSSFSFTTVRDEWNWQANPPQRRLLEVGLVDVGPVTFPAYPDATAAARALAPIAEKLNLPIDDLVTAAKTGELRSLMVRSLVFGDAEESRVVWTSGYVNELPDSAFLSIEPGGKTDAGGKTAPRSLRHFPYRDDSGVIDMPHLRNALTRIPQAPLSDQVKEKLTAMATNILNGTDSQTTMRALPTGEGAVAWGTEDGFRDLLHGVNEALGELADPAEFFATDASVSLDKVLLRSWDEGAWVAPIAVADDGTLAIAERSEWAQLDGDESDADEFGRARQLLAETRAGKTISAKNMDSIRNVHDSLQAAAKGLRDLMDAALGEAPADSDTAQVVLEQNSLTISAAQLELRHRMAVVEAEMVAA